MRRDQICIKGLNNGATVRFFKALGAKDAFDWEHPVDSKIAEGRFFRVNQEDVIEVTGYSPKKDVLVRLTESGLPENWAVRCDGSQLYEDTVVNRINGLFTGRYGAREGNYLGEYKGDIFKAYSVPPKLPRDMVQLSLQEFITITGMQEQKREIIGYKAPHDLFGGDMKAGILYKKFNSCSYYPEGSSRLETYRLPKEIVEQWEPIYAPQEFKLFGRRVARAGENFDGIIINEYMYNTTDLHEFRRVLQFAQIKSFNVGCNGQFKLTLEHVEQLIKFNESGTIPEGNS